MGFLWVSINTEAYRRVHSAYKFNNLNMLSGQLA